MTEMRTDRRTEIKIRKLSYSDLPSVIAIERRSFPTPWSLAMFVLELSKPQGICLAAEDEDGLVGYLVCARYDRVWHLMNVAIAPEHRRRGIARALIEHLFDEAGQRRPLHARGPDLQPARDRHVRGVRLPLGRAPPPLLPRQRRGRPDHVVRGLARPGRRLGGAGPALRLLALETSCDDTCAAVTDGATVLSSVISSQAAFHERYGGVVPEVASRHHLELVNSVVDAALDEAGTDLASLDAVAVTQGPGLIGALLVGVSTAKALAAAHRLPLIAVDHLHGHVAANFLEPEPLEPPFLCLIASGGHTLMTAVREPRSFEVLGGHARRRGGRGLRQGRPAARARLPRRPRDPARGRGRRPRRLRVPRRDDPRPGARLLLQRPEDRARLQGPRAGRGRAPARPAPTSPPATSGRSSSSSSRSSAAR